MVNVFPICIYFRKSNSLGPVQYALVVISVKHMHVSSVTVYYLDSQNLLVIYLITNLKSTFHLCYYGHLYEMSHLKIK